MPKNESVEFFLRFLRERFNVFRVALSTFLQALTQDDRAKKIETANATLAGGIVKSGVCELIKRRPAGIELECV